MPMKKLLSTYVRPRETLIASFFAHPAAFTLSLCLSISFLLSAMFFFLPLYRQGVPGLVGISVLVAISGVLFMRVLTLRKSSATLITDERVIMVKRKGVLEEEVAEVPLDLISDIRYRRKGPWQMSFNFGTLFIKSQSSEPLEVLNLPQPRKVQELLFELQAQRRNSDKEKQDILVNEFLNLAKNIKYQSKLDEKEDEF